MIAVYGPDWVICREGEHVAVARVTNDTVHSLDSSGGARALKGVCERVEVFCKGERLVCCVEYDNPKREALKRHYARYGFHAIGELLERKIK